jgi:hypothetical protein
MAKSSTATGSATTDQGSSARTSTVVQEHISILKEINAPAPLIEIAERVAATSPAPPKK